MFVNMIYYDAPRVSDFGAIIKGSKNIKIEKMDIVNDKGANITLPAVGGNIKASKSYEATIEESILFDCREFEKLLVGRDDYFDFTENVGLDIATLGRGHIIKFDSTIKVPEEFDLTQTIAQFKPYLISSISKDMDSDEGAAFSAFFESANPKIPIIAECDDVVLSAKIDSKFLMVDYARTQAYESSELSILARVISTNIVSASKAIYDPLKDFISLNRAIRRSLTDNRPDGLKELFNDEDYKVIEILAIYQ